MGVCETVFLVFARCYCPIFVDVFCSILEILLLRYCFHIVHLSGEHRQNLACYERHRRNVFLSNVYSSKLMNESHLGIEISSIFT